MKYTFTVLLAFLVTLILAPEVMAGKNAPSHTGAKTACGIGSCFVPDFGAVGAINSYKNLSSGAVFIIQAADCCTAGDTYSVTVKGTSPDKGSVTFISSGALNADCTTSTPADARSVTVRDAKTAKMKAVALPGGVPAGAYIQMSGSWKQTGGVDDCGF